jgi:hypothetical protein
MGRLLIIVIPLVIIGSLLFYFLNQKPETTGSNLNFDNTSITEYEDTDLNPLAIKAMREKSYTGSTISIEQKLPSEANYDLYIASYLSKT